MTLIFWNHFILVIWSAVNAYERLSTWTYTIELEVCKQLHVTIIWGYEDLWTFSHKRISEIKYWWQTRWPGVQLVFQFTPKVLNGVRALRRPLKFFHTILVVLNLTLCSSPSLKEILKATIYKDILNNYVDLIREDWWVGAMVRCPHSLAI